MKKYGQADLMMKLVDEFLENCQYLTEEQKEKIKRKSYETILKNYPLARELEFDK